MKLNISVLLSGLSYSLFLLIGNFYAEPIYHAKFIKFITFVFVLGQISAMGMPLVMQSKLLNQKHDDDKLHIFKKVFSILCLSSVLLALFLMLLNDMMGFEYTWIYPVCYLILLFNALGKVLQVYCGYFGKFDEISYGNFGRAIGFSLCIISYLINFYLLIPLMILVIETLNVAGYYSTIKYCFSTFTSNRKNFENSMFSDYNDFVKSGIKFLPYGFLQELVNRVDLLIISAIATPAIASAYALVQNSFEAALVGVGIVKTRHMEKLLSSSKLSITAAFTVIKEIRSIWRPLFIAASLLIVALFTFMAYNFELNLEFLISISIILFFLYFNFDLLLLETLLIGRNQSLLLNGLLFCMLVFKTISCYILFMVFGVLGVAFGVSISIFFYCLFLKIAVSKSLSINEG